MKKMNLSEVKEKVKQAVQDANFIIDQDLKKLIQDYHAKEESPAGQEVLRQILQNADIAAEEKLALCQDTGLAIFFIEMGEKVKLEYAGFKSLQDAISQGTSRRLRRRLPAQVGLRPAQPQEQRRQHPGLHPLGRRSRRRFQDHLHGQGRRRGEHERPEDDAAFGQ